MRKRTKENNILKLFSILVIGVCLLLGGVFTVNNSKVYADEIYEARIEDTYYSKLSQAWTAANTNGTSEETRKTIVLLKNVTAVSGSFGTSEKYLLVSKTKFIELDLNGFTLSRGLTSEINEGYVIKNQGNLIISDTSENLSGMITGGYNSNYNPNDQLGGGGIFSSGTMVLNTVKISGNTSRYGGGVFIRDNAQLTINGAEISNNIIQGIGSGGGIYSENSTTTFNSGTIKNNTAMSGGGAIMLAPLSKFIMNGGFITGNQSANAAFGHGGAVYVYASVFDMYSGVIENNKAALKGGAVFLEVETKGRGLSTFNMHGGLITNNTATSEGGAVHVDDNVSIYGNAVIKNNVIGGTFTNNVVSGGVENNIYLKNTKKLNFIGENTQSFTGEFGVTMQTPGVFTNGWTTSNSSGKTTSDSSLYIVLPENNERTLGNISSAVATITINDDTRYFTTLEDAFTSANQESLQENANVLVTLLNNATATSGNFGSNGYLEISQNANITLDLNGKTIDRKLTAPAENGQVTLLGKWAYHLKKNKL